VLADGCDEVLSQLHPGGGLALAHQHAGSGPRTGTGAGRRDTEAAQQLDALVLKCLNASSTKCTASPVATRALALTAPLGTSTASNITEGMLT